MKYTYFAYHFKHSTYISSYSICENVIQLIINFYLPMYYLHMSPREDCHLCRFFVIFLRKFWYWVLVQFFCGAWLVHKYASCNKELKRENFCFLDLNLSCFGPRGPPWKIFKEKILNVENKSCPTIISEQLCEKTKNSHSLSFQDNGGPAFQAKKH